MAEPRGQRVDSPRGALERAEPRGRPQRPQPAPVARVLRPADFAPTKPAPRIGSVDALRGFTIACIIGLDGAALSLRDMSREAGPVLGRVGQILGSQFEHAEWDGFRFYDLIFPLLIFVTGIAVVLSLPRIIEREGRLHAHLRVLRRTLLLFGLGFLFYGGFSVPFSEIRMSGVLQRIALCYLAASLLFMHLRLRGLVVAFGAILLGYWAAMTFVPVPGVGAGSLVPGANLSDWIDARYLPGRLFLGDRDPEGLLSTLPAVATCLIGVFAGLLLVDPRIEPQRKSLWLIGAGLAAAAGGFLWGLEFPIIKSLWTSSFVLVSGGCSLLLLGVLYHLIDVRQQRAWPEIFVWVGANAITLYLLNGIAGFERLATRFMGGDIAGFLDRTIAPSTGRFVSHALGVVLAVLLARFLYRRKIFLRV
ncbi:MAG TPA: hypothetical protein VFQ27_09180 [Xanthobacteraceae bacterium]|nr:hypothetical protein [Xanthobacteraceae bacterium]